MPEFTVSYDSCMEAARLASSRGDRLGAEQALTAAIAVAGIAGSTELQRANALIKLGELKRDAGNLSEAEEIFVRALAICDGAPIDDDTPLVSALTSLAAIRTARAAPEEAEVLLTRALALSEKRLGRDHPDLVVLLNDLSRLYLKRSAFALAEPLLLRLHAIKRVKGEEHPEVATVLASLATVRQALGDHDAAEQLWRRVLTIRERTLAPNHFAIATAYEHLAETCSARGKVAEALRLYHRALAMREMTLGVGHPSLRVSRERIADLQLQGAEEFAPDDDVPSTAPTTEWRIPAKMDYPAVELPSPVPTPTPTVAPTIAPPPARASTAERRPAAVREAVVRPVTYAPPAPAPTPAPVMQQAVAAPPAPIPYAQPAAPELEIPTWLEREQSTPVAAPMSAAAQPLAIIVPSTTSIAVEEDDDLDLMDDYEVVGGRMQNIAASLRGLFRQRQTQAIAAGAVTVTLLVVAAATASQARNASDETSGGQPAPSAQEYVAGGIAALPDSGTTRSSASKAAPRTSTAEADAPAAPAVTDRTRSDATQGDRAATKTSTASESPAALKLPNPGDFSRGLSGVSTAQLDSAMRSAGNSRVAVSTAPVVSSTFSPSEKALGTVDYGAEASKQSPAILIGAVPRIPYPQNLRAKGRETGGEVLIEFTVDTLGRPDMGSLNVVHSDHDLLTAAVRRVIPSMRFVPAQNMGKKTTGKVQVPFYFSVAKKE